MCIRLVRAYSPGTATGWLKAKIVPSSDIGEGGRRRTPYAKFGRIPDHLYARPSSELQSATGQQVDGAPAERRTLMLVQLLPPLIWQFAVIAIVAIEARAHPASPRSERLETHQQV